MIEITKLSANQIVFSVKGSLNYANQAKMKEELLKLIPASVVDVVLDFSQVEFIDSACLGALISIMRVLRDRDGDLKILAAQDEVKSILQITRLDKVFTLIDQL